MYLKMLIDGYKINRMQNLAKYSEAIPSACLH